MAGTDEQKRKYLPKLASGEWTAALCANEADNALDSTSIKTAAVPTSDGKGYRISGLKNVVFNGKKAHLLTVLARVKVTFF